MPFLGGFMGVLGGIGRFYKPFSQIGDYSGGIGRYIGVYRVGGGI